MTQRSARGRRRAGRWAGAMLFLCPSAVVAWQLVSPATSQASSPPTTVSQYEMSANPTTLYAQGAAAGQTDSQGLVILDFGRPGADGTTLGTVTHADTFASFTAIAAGTEAYIDGYFEEAPSDTHLYIAIGTNNSCGTGQPCGSVVCGCSLEPTSYSAWGAALAATVESIQGWSTSLKQQSGFTDTVTVDAGDDIEPAYDPGYYNTYDVLAGYAAAVGGYQPAMVDYGSSDPGFWSETQLLQVANGFRPDVLVPQLYFPAFITEWASLLSYAKNQGETVTIFGFLTATSTGNSPSTSYSSMVNALASITGQTSIRWASTIGTS